MWCKQAVVQGAISFVDFTRNGDAGGFEVRL